MNVIFLDIDGVLNGDDTVERAPSGCFFVDEVRMARLVRITKSTGAKLVLTSSWRRGWSDIENGRTETKDTLDFIALKTALYAHGLELIGKTPESEEDYRGKEIQEWLDKWDGEPVESMVILDDDGDMEPFMTKLVLTSFSDGLQDADADRAVAILKDSAL